MSKIMNFLNSIAIKFMGLDVPQGDVKFWQSYFGELDDKTLRYLQSKYGWVKTIINTVNTILVPILAIVAAAGIIWAIVLGVNMARADSTDKREECKKRLIFLIIGIVVLVVLIIFFTTLFPLIIKSTVGVSATVPDDWTDPGGTVSRP
ncbi:MAG: hypothetical protein ACI4L1_01265 [Christensenellales bacterium]